MNKIKYLFLFLILSGASVMAVTPQNNGVLTLGPTTPSSTPPAPPATPPASTIPAYAAVPIPAGRYALQQPGDTNPPVTADEYVAFLIQEGIFLNKQSTINGLPFYGDVSLSAPATGCFDLTGTDINAPQYTICVKPGMGNQVIVSSSSASVAIRFQQWREYPSLADLQKYINAQFQLEYVVGTPASNPTDLSNTDFILSNYYPEYENQRSVAAVDNNSIITQLRGRYPYAQNTLDAADAIVENLVELLPKCTPSNSLSYILIQAANLQNIINIPTFYYSDTMTKDPNFSGVSDLFNTVPGFSNVSFYPNGAIRPFVIPAERIAAYVLDQTKLFYRLKSPITTQWGSVNVQWPASPAGYGLYNGVYSKQACLDAAINFTSTTYQPSYDLHAPAATVTLNPGTSFSLPSFSVPLLGDQLTNSLDQFCIPSSGN